MDKHIVAQVEAALSEVLEREITGLTEEARLLEDLHLDSTSVMEMLMHLEDSLGIVIDPENLDMEDFQSVGTLTAYLARVAPEPQLQGR
ncbi:acyl carrier protein [Streptomyces cavernicola]|uniref:Phosphopantetheine-binding protein n=1 Tax=Streptomyces cavernicola TaxID=3043613 RepID=A0ABT6SLE4_9ACTN|nr:phosphopantetheine-binding protein [Streptomyces sp. B-S-A6]MDI3408218.1 phosphopantetheine-binding protein [Streptomyces sp. B-S-A6]